MKVTAAHVIAYWAVAFIAIPLTINYIDYAVELMGLRPIDEINMGAVFFWTNYPWIVAWNRNLMD